MTTTSESSWRITGSEGEAIIGDCHLPASSGGSADAGAVMLLVHGFLGYKDYGMFPFLARCMAEAGIVAHRFNLAHSGMTNDIETFARPDLFERDTWNHQVADIDAVVSAIQEGELAGAGLPIVYFGHSRGGVTALLNAGRRFMGDQDPKPAGIIAASAPSSTCMLSEDQQQGILQQGYYEVTSSRTGQTLRINKRSLEEQLQDPEGHDLARHVAAIGCPLLIVHGGADPTVPAGSADELAGMAGDGARVRLMVIEGANHVFNAPNPMPPEAEPAPQLADLAEAMKSLVSTLGTRPVH